MAQNSKYESVMLNGNKIQIENNDIETLNEGRFINDNIFLFGTSMVADKVVQQENREKVKIFDTMFWEKLKRSNAIGWDQSLDKWGKKRKLVKERNNCSSSQHRKNTLVCDHLHCSKRT